MLIRLTRMCWTLMINDKKEKIIKSLIGFKSGSRWNNFTIKWIFLYKMKGVMPINGTIKC